MDEVLPPEKMAAYGLQHVLAMYAGVILVPLMLATIGLPQEQIVYIINASFLMCGVATVIQTIGFWKFGVRLRLLPKLAALGASTPLLVHGSGRWG